MLPATGAERPLAPVIERAVELHRQNNDAEAEKLSLSVLELVPSQLDALSLLYRIRRAGGRRAPPTPFCAASSRSTRTRSGRPTSSPSAY
jgi:hypothetical protein